MENFVGIINGFSGCDIGIYQGTLRIGTANGLSWSITREKAPIYVPKDYDLDKARRRYAFSRAKHAIAGSIIFHDLDREKILNNTFNVRITGADENGKLRSMCITGMKLITAGEDVQPAEAELETQHTWVGCDLIPWSEDG